MHSWRHAVVPLALAFACAHAEETEREPEPAQPLGDEAPLAEASEPAVQEPATPVQRPRAPGTIFRDELVRATNGGRPGYLTRQLHPEAHRPAGRFQGWRITHVFPDDPGLCAPSCDLRPNDVVLSVNGSPLERPEQLSALVEGIGTMTQLRVRLVRDGKLHERTYTIVD